MVKEFYIWSENCRQHRYRPLRIYCDNSVVVFLSKNDKYSKGTKHIELKYFAMKTKVQKQRASIEHISKNLMIADPLIEGLPLKTFTEHIENMNIIIIIDGR